MSLAELKQKLIASMPDSVSGFVKNKIGLKSGVGESINETTNADSQKSDTVKTKALSATRNMLGAMQTKLGDILADREEVLGVEISPHYVRICQMKKAYDRWSLLNLASSCIEDKFHNNDITANPEIYIENLKSLLEKNKIKIKKASVAIPTTAIIAQMVRLPEMNNEDFKEAVAFGSIWESLVQLDGSINEYNVFYKIIARDSEAHTDKTGNDSGTKSSETLTENTTDEKKNDDDVNWEYVENKQQQENSESTNVTATATTDDNTDTNIDSEKTTAPTEIPEQTNKEANLDTDTTSNLDTAEPQAIAIDNIDTTENSTKDQEQQNSDLPTQPQDTTSLPEVDIENHNEVINAEPQTNELDVSNQDISTEVTDTDETVTVEVQEEQAQEAMMDVLFVAVKLLDIIQYIDIAEQAGLTPVIVMPRCFSLARAFSINPELKNTKALYAISEFGPDENVVTVIDNETVYKYDLIISDEDKALLARNDNDVEKVKELVKKYSEQIREKLNEHKQAHETRPNKIYVSSCSPLHVNDIESEPFINTFITQMKESLPEFEIHSCDFCDHIKVPEKFTKTVNAEGNLSAWAVTVGVASGKVDIFNSLVDDKAVNKVNLLPELERYKSSERFKILSSISYVIIFAILLSGLSLVYLNYNNTHKQLMATLKELGTVESDYAAKEEELQKLSVIMNKVESLDDIRDSLPSNQIQILQAYKHMQSVIPEGVWLDSVKFTYPGTVRIIGNAIADQNILVFVDKLNTGEIFEKISMKNMSVVKEKDDTTKRSTTVKKFTLEGTIDTPNVNLLSKL